MTCRLPFAFPAHAAALGLTLFAGGLGSQAAEVVINEVMADNHAAVVNAGDYPDWIELYNTTDQMVNLGGWSLTDDLTFPGRFVFPANTLIAAKGYLLVWCDSATAAPGLHTGFALDNLGQTLGLFSPQLPPRLVDSVAFGHQLEDLSIGRVPDGSGAFVLTQPTAVKANQAQSTGPASGLRINEWMADPDSGDDWFELYNPSALPVPLAGLWLSDKLNNPANTQIPSQTYIAANEFLRFWADQHPEDGSTHVDFKLSNEGESIGLFTASGQPIDTVSFGPQTTDVSQGRLPDGTATVVAFPTSATPGESNYLPLTSVLINEVLSHTDPPFEDAIELYNPSPTAVPIGGWYLSNNRHEPKKYQIPAGVSVPPGGFQVFYEYQFNANPDQPGNFNFNSAHGDEAVLSAANSGVLTGHRAQVEFGAAAQLVSFGRIAISTGADFAPLSTHTFGQDNPTSLAQFRSGTGLPNAGPLLSSVVISEIMFHPPDLITTVTNDNTRDEFVELYNPTAETVPLYHPFYPENTWRLDGGVSYRFPRGVSLAAGQTLVVVSFDPDADKTELAAFRAQYGIGTEVRLYGPFEGKLDNAGEGISLLRPDDPQLPPHPDAGYVPKLDVDRIQYVDRTPWPEGADGTGASLQRLDSKAYGNDPANWSALPPTPGQPTRGLAFDAAFVSAGRVVLRFTAVPGHTYTLQSRNAVGTGTWTKLKDFPASEVLRVQEATDSLTSPEGARFYRLRSPFVP